MGGGPAGAVAALVLARRGVSVAVLEASAEPAMKVGETLPPGVAPLLSRLGLDGWLARDGHLRSAGNRSLWGSARPIDSPFLANPYGSGWHVDRRLFEARLAAAACAAGAHWFWGCRVRHCARDGRWQLAVAPEVTVTAAEATPPDRQVEALEGVETVETDFLADATGRPARLARRWGGARRLRYDRLVGISALLPARRPAHEGEAAVTGDGYTWVEATAGGWWYSAPLADGRLAVALLSDGDLLAPLLRGGDTGEWIRRLEQAEATRARLASHGVDPGDAAIRLSVSPAESSRLDRIAGDGWLALGDAAAAFDPLSSHGIVAAMGSGFYGGQAIADLLAGRDEARDAYLHVMQRSYGAYLDLLRERYAAERRWSGAPFWSRRHAAAFATAPL